MPPPVEPAPTPSQQVAGAAFLAASNTMSLTTLGPDVPAIAAGINVLLQDLKNRRWFREDVWTVPVLVALSFAVALGLALLVSGDMARGIVNGFGIIGTAHGNYGASKAMGLPVLPPTAPENRWQQRG